MGIRGIGQNFRVAHQGSNGFRGIRSACFHVDVTEAVEGRGKIGIHLERSFQGGAGAVIILLKKEPFAGQVKNVLVARVALEKLVHVDDSGEQVALLNADHPASEKLLVGSGARQQGFGFCQRGGIRHAAAGGEGKHGVT